MCAAKATINAIFYEYETEHRTEGCANKGHEAYYQREGGTTYIGACCCCCCCCMACGAGG